MAQRDNHVYAIGGNLWDIFNPQVCGIFIDAGLLLYPYLDIYLPGAGTDLARGSFPGKEGRFMKRSGIKIGVVIIIFCTLFGLTGCWDVRDFSRIAFVTAIGLDKSQISDGYYRVTFEIIAPEKLKSGKRPATIIEAVDGQSIGEAVEKLQTRMPRVINFDHFRALIVGEEQCKEDFRDIISYFQKNIDIALRFRIGLVQNGRAEDILNYKPRFHRTIAGEYVALTELEKDISLSFGGLSINLCRICKTTRETA